MNLYEKEVAKKHEIAKQEELESKLGHIVDVPKTDFGNINHGNTSRRFFMYPQLAATMTRVDEQLIYRLKVILEAISSGQKGDTQKFDAYCTDTPKLYANLYG